MQNKCTKPTESKSFRPKKIPREKDPNQKSHKTTQTKIRELQEYRQNLRLQQKPITVQKTLVWQLCRRNLSRQTIVRLSRKKNNFRH